MPLRDYLCHYCGHEFTELVYDTEPEEYAVVECRCGSKAKVLPALIGGYSGNMGPSSTRPKNSTAMPKKKVFTGNQGEPEAQLEFDLKDKKGPYTEKGIDGKDFE